MTLRAAAWLVVVLHLLGCVAAVLIMRPGIAPVPLEERIRYLATPLPGKLWHGAWLLWALAGISLLVFFAFVVDHVGPRTRRVTLSIVGAAVAVDIFCDSLQACLTELARAGDTRGFVLVERVANVGGMVAANGLYTLAVAVVTPLLPGPVARVFGGGVAVAGAAMVVGGIIGDVRIMPLVVAVLVVCLCGWALLTARALDDGRT